MRFTLLLAAFLWASTGYAQIVEPGTIVVVWGAVKGCEDWTDRILDIEVVPLEGAIELLGQELNIQGLSGNEVLGQINANILGQTGRVPTTLRFSIERRITRKLAQAYANSQTHLEAGTCPITHSSREQPGHLRRRTKKYEGDIPLPVKLEIRNIVAHPSAPDQIG